MKKFISILLVSICCIILISCGNSNKHNGEAKTPSGSSVMKGKDYESVVKLFEEKGFTNIKLEKIEDLITGWLTKEGEVEEVSVGGDFDYSPDKWVLADTEVVIRYHAFPEKETKKDEQTEQKSEENTKQEDIEQKDTTENTIENNEEESVSDEILTINNCQELANMLLNKADIDKSYSDFASKYSGKTIEFDGRIDYLVKHGDSKTRYDILLFAGDYDPNHQTGPAFKFEDVAAYDLDLDTLFLEEKIQVGKNVRVTAKVIKFDSKSGLFFLDPISVTER